MDLSNSDMSGSMPSPLAALEQLASELAQERARCTQALRDRARQKVVIEKLQQNQDILQDQVRQLKEQLASAIEQTEYGSFEQSQQGMQLAANTRELTQAKRELEEATREVAASRSTTQELRDSLSSLTVEMDRLRAALDAEQDRSRALEAEAEAVKGGADRAKAAKAEADSMMSSVHSKVYEQMKEINDLKTKSRVADAMSEKYAALVHSDAEIRERLDESLQRNHALAQSVRELSEQGMEKDLEIASLREELERRTREAETLADDLEESQRAQTELALQADALRSSAASEKARIDSFVRSHDYLESHVAELRASHTASLQKYAALEIEHANAQSTICNLNVELTETRNQLAHLEALSKEAESAAALAVEVERLNAELSDVRRQLVRRDLDEEAAMALFQQGGGDASSLRGGDTGSGLLSVKLLSEREKHTKQVYEGIIEDLRNSIDTLTTENYNIAQQLEVVGRKAARVDRLEDEVAMYKEAVKANAVENQSAVLSAYEALERNQKTTHDSQTLVRSVRAAEQSLALAQTEAARLREELQEERRRARTLHTDKLGAERRVTEALAEISRLETVVAEVSSQNEMKKYEMSKLESLNSELQQTCNLLKQRGGSVSEEVEAARGRVADLQAQLQAKTRVQEQASAEARALRDSKVSMQAEINTLNDVLATQRRAATESNAQIEKLRLNIISLQNALETKQKEDLRVGSLSAEQQLKGIRGDLNRTIGDWKETERERLEREEARRRLQNELVKERDKSLLLASQITKLEERLMQANKELASYRIVDVYRSSKEAELASMRMSSVGLGSASPRVSVVASPHPSPSSSAGAYGTPRPVAVDEGERLERNANQAYTARSSETGNPIDELSDDDDISLNRGKSSSTEVRPSHRSPPAKPSSAVVPPVPPFSSSSVSSAASPRHIHDLDAAAAPSIFDSVPYVPYAPSAPSALSASGGSSAPRFAERNPSGSTSSRYATTPLNEASFTQSRPVRTPSSAVANSSGVRPVRPHRDASYDPSRADFDRARKLLSMSGGSSHKK